MPLPPTLPVNFSAVSMASRLLDDVVLLLAELEFNSEDLAVVGPLPAARKPNPLVSILFRRLRWAIVKIFPSFFSDAGGLG